MAIESISNAFGIMIAQERVRKRLNQTEVADAAGITQAYLSKLERGQREPGIMIALKLCKVLDIDINKFFADFI